MRIFVLLQYLHTLTHYCSRKKKSLTLSYIPIYVVNLPTFVVFILVAQKWEYCFFCSPVKFGRMDLAGFGPSMAKYFRFRATIWKLITHFLQIFEQFLGILTPIFKKTEFRKIFWNGQKKFLEVQQIFSENTKIILKNFKKLMDDLEKKLDKFSENFGNILRKF